MKQAGDVAVGAQNNWPLEVNESDLFELGASRGCSSSAEELFYLAADAKQVRTGACWCEISCQNNCIILPK